MEENVQSTLLEYGAYFASMPKTEREKSDSVKQLEESLGKGEKYAIHNNTSGKKKPSAEDEEEEKKRNELKKELTQFVSSERVQNVGNLFSGNIDEVSVYMQACNLS